MTINFASRKLSRWLLAAILPLEPGILLAQPPVTPPPAVPGPVAPQGLEQPVLEVPYQRSIVLQIPGVLRVISVNPGVVEAVLRSPGVIELRAAAFGRTFVHLWSISGRVTRAVKVVQPVPVRAAAAEQQRAAAEARASHLTVDYRTRFRTFRRGPSLGEMDQNTTTQFDHDVIGEMPTPYGRLSGRVLFQRLNQTNELSSWRAGIRQGAVGPLKRFDLIGGDTQVGFSDLTLPGGTVRGAKFRYYDPDPYQLEAFHGRRRLGFATSLSPRGETNDDVFLSGLRLQDVQRPWTWSLAYATASGEDRSPIQTNQAMEAETWFWPHDELGFGAHAGRTQDDAYGYRLKSSLRHEVWDLDATYRNFSQRYENLLGRSAEQGERGLLVRSRVQPMRRIRLHQRLDLYEDDLFPNPQEPDQLNLEAELGGDLDLTASTVWSASVSRRRLLGRFFPTETTDVTTGLRQRLRGFPFLDRGSLFTQYQFRDLRSVNAPGSDFDSHTIRLGLGAPLTDALSWHASQQWSFLEETLSGAESVPRQTTAGVNYSQRFKRLPLSLRGGFNFFTASNAASPNSFLADEDRWVWDAGLRYFLSPDAEAYVDSQVVRRQRASGRQYEIDVETGVRYFFDTGIAWLPSAALSGVVFQDIDADGRQQAGEAGLPGVTVAAGLERRAVTDAGGRFYLGRLRGTQATVAVDLSTTPPGFVPTTPSTVELDLARPPISLLFGFIAQAEVRVRVFVDAQGNGQYDATDVPLEEVRVALEDGAVIRTDSAGWAFFRGLSPGEHRITLRVEDLAIGYVPATLPAQERSLREGEAVLVDFPIRAERSIAGRVYVDRNRNGRYDTEPALSNVVVCLDEGRQVKTREDGRYLFKGVPAGLHRLALNCGRLLEGYLPLNATVQTVDIPPQPVQVDTVDFRLGEEAAILQDVIADVLRARGISGRDTAMDEALEAARRAKQAGQVPSGPPGAAPRAPSAPPARRGERAATATLNVIVEVP